MTIRLYNTLSRKKEQLNPIDPGNVRLYVCGPTVYDHIHIGNARPIIVFDVLFRLLRHQYGADQVTYARNITDVDDKINARAAERGISIGELTETTTRQFHDDIAALGVLEPTVEPRATDHIGEMAAIIEKLVERGHAYVAQDHVLFDVKSMPDYGRLSNRSLDEMQAGARVEIASYKRDPMDFVLWKPSKQGEPSWPSPCRINAGGRPGWHIECSAMADKLLWQDMKSELSEAGLARPHEFDIHGGGIDLVFPHHENEIAQSRCAHGTDVMASIFMHNGFLQLEGEKMSKSEGNFVTVHELLATDKFGQRHWPGEALRLAMLMTHYRQPIDWTANRIKVAERTIDDWYRVIPDTVEPSDPLPEVMDALCDDLNTPHAISAIGRAIQKAKEQSRKFDLTGLMEDTYPRIKASAQMLGLQQSSFNSWHSWLKGLVALTEGDEEWIVQLITARNAARKAKNWAEADRIRDELAAQGIQLMDAKDPNTGEIVTTWEMKR